MINIKEYVREEMSKYDGKYLPVRVNFLQRIFTKNLAPGKLHPNPDDEFCMKDVGPNDEIIGKYIKKITFNRQHSLPVFDEPLIIEENPVVSYEAVHERAVQYAKDHEDPKVRLENKKKSRKNYA